MMEEIDRLRKELAELLGNFYNGSFTRMACDYIHATRMTQEEVEELLEAMSDMKNVVTS